MGEAHYFLCALKRVGSINIYCWLGNCALKSLGRAPQHWVLRLNGVGTNPHISHIEAFRCEFAVAWILTQDFDHHTASDLHAYFYQSESRELRIRFP